MTSNASQSTIPSDSSNEDLLMLLRLSTQMSLVASSLEKLIEEVLSIPESKRSRNIVLLKTASLYASWTSYVKTLKAENFTLEIGMDQEQLQMLACESTELKLAWENLHNQLGSHRS